MQTQETNMLSTNGARELLKKYGVQAPKIKDLLTFFDLKSGSLDHGSQRTFIRKADFDKIINAAK